MKYFIFKKKVLSCGKYVHRWYYWFYDDKKNRCQARCKGCKTKLEAMEYVQKMSNVSRYNVEDWIRYMFVPQSDYMRYRDLLNRPCSKITLQSYNQYSKVIIRDFGKKKLADLTVKDVVDCLSAKNRKNSWKNVYLVVMKEMYKWAIYNGEKVDMPKFPRFRSVAKKSDILTMQEIKCVFKRENFDTDEHYFACKLMLLTGMRSGEALAARRCQFDFERQFVVVDGFLRADERTDYNKKGSNEDKKWRVSPLPIFFARELKAFVHDKKIGEDDLIFVKQEDMQGEQKRVYCSFQRALKNAGVVSDGRKLTCHSLRYTYITYSRSMLEGETVRKIAGHNSMEMTEYYTRASVEDACKQLNPIISVVNTFFSQLQQEPESEKI